MTFGKWLVTGLCSAFFFMGMCGFFATGNAGCLTGSALFMMVVAGCYGIATS